MDADKKRQKPSVSLSPEITQALYDAKEKTGISISALVDACVKQKLDLIVAAMTGDCVKSAGDGPAPKPQNRR